MLEQVYSYRSPQKTPVLSNGALTVNKPKQLPLFQRQIATKWKLHPF